MFINGMRGLAYMVGLDQPLTDQTEQCTLFDSLFKNWEIKAAHKSGTTFVVAADSGPNATMYDVVSGTWAGSPYVVMVWGKWPV